MIGFIEKNSWFFGRALLVSFWLLLLVAPIVFVICALSGLPLLVGLFWYLATANLGYSLLLVAAGPAFVLLLWNDAASWLQKEKDIIDHLGPERALWVSRHARSSTGTVLLAGSSLAVWQGWDLTGDLLSSSSVAPVLHTLGITEEQVKEGMASIGSRLWSKVILALHGSVVLKVGRIVSAALSIYFWSRVVSKTFTAAIRYWALAFSLGLVLVELPARWPVNFVLSIFRLARKLDRVTRSQIYDWICWRFTLLAADSLVLTMDIDHAIKRKVSRQLAGDTVTFVAHFREFVVQSVSTVADLKLPEYIRSQGWIKPNVQVLQASNDLMKEIGWPVNVSLSNAPDPIGFKYKEWLLCGSDMKTGILNIKARVDEDLRAIIGSDDLYKRTETYATEQNELDATSRYFSKPKYDMPDLALDDVWLLLKPIFKESRITPFNHIIKMWEKKYSLGAFMQDPRSHKRYQRRRFISDLGGYAPFKALWAKTFFWSTRILPTASVSVKGEALPPRKWMENKVRTVIGSPISQYILSTIWNYGPNHRFSWESTPIKIGMPLNGGTMGQIWADHSRCQLHVEGDFTSFDSTLSGNVLKLVAAVRKKGFESHSDRKRIADLIDINYDQVVNQLLNTHSTGNVYKKGTGLTTGHSSTSMDNSVATVVLYLMAWKEITGLSAREFKFYNELSCFGDDHFLSILGFHPSGWTPTNIRKTMSHWGVENNLIVKPLHEIEFLAKFCRRPNAQMRSELNAVGLNNITMAVYHNKQKLIGKLTAQVKTLNPTYKVERLKSFLGLTAHHKDIYDGIVRYFEKNSTMQRVLRASGNPLPSYSKVMKDWYSHTSEQPRTPWIDEEKDEMENTGKLFSYGEVTAIDSILGTFSLLPDVLNPTIFNYGYHRILQARLRRHLAWIYDFIVLQNGLTENGAVKFALSRTPYRFIEPELFVLGDSGSNMTELLMRHWVYTLGVRFMPRMRPPAIIDFIVRRTASLQYLINGKLQSEMATANPFVMQICLAVAVSFIHCPDWFGFVSKARLPDVNAFIQMASHLVMVTVWQNVPALYQEVERGMINHSWDKGPILIEAATGTGKSTDLPLFMANRFGHVYSKVILLVPRTALAVSLVSYLSTISTVGISGSCEGLTLDRDAKLWVVTAAAYWQLVGTLPDNTLLIFDESHLIEDRHVLTRLMAIKNKWPMLMTTATPSVANTVECGLHLRLNAANLFSRTDLVVKPCAEEITIEDLDRRLVVDLLNVGRKCRPNNRVLFFVNTKTQAETFARMAPRKTAVLVSGVPIDTSFQSQWYVSTTVADVGLTIPDLDVVVTANVTPWGKGKARAMGTALYKQRAGRTGRTNNGIVYLLQYDVQVEKVPDTIPIDAPLLAQLFPSGLPPSLVANVWPDETLAALGVPHATIDPVVKTRLIASADFMLSTVMPTSQHLRQAELENNSAVGDPFWPEPGTISAAFSRTHPQNQDTWNSEVMEALQFVLDSAKTNHEKFLATGVKPPSAYSTIPAKFSVTGLQKVCADVLGLWRDPAMALKSLKMRIPAKYLEELSAAFDIADMLKSE